MVTMKDIRTAAQAYADCMLVLEGVQAARKEADNKHAAIEEEALEAAGEARQMLETLLSDETAAELFQRPKTQTIAGVTVGFRKGSIKLVYDELRTMALIRTELPYSAPRLIKTSTSIQAAVLKTLTPEELVTIGVSTAQGKDVIVISYGNKDAERAVQGYGKGAE